MGEGGEGTQANVQLTGASQGSMRTSNWTLETNHPGTVTMHQELKTQVL